MPDLFNTGIRPAIDQHIAKLAEEKRDYGDYWSASSAGYCMRKNIFDRLQIPHTTEEVDKARKQRIFSCGHIFHDWIQQITKEAGLSIAQELELQDEDLMVRGHIDDLVLLPPEDETHMFTESNLILYDYKTRNSKGFATYSKIPSYFHKMQTGTYVYMLRKREWVEGFNKTDREVGDLSEARILNISKDDLRMTEVQYMYSDKVEKEVVDYWTTLNGYWEEKKLPPCTCDKEAGGFMAKEKWNPYFYNDKPCSIEWFQKHPELIKKWKEA